MALFVAIVTFLTALGIVFGVWLLAGRCRQQDVVRQRLDAVRMAERRGTDPTDLKLVRDEMLSTVPALNRMSAAMVLGGPPAQIYLSGRL